MKADKCRHRLSTIQQSYDGHMDSMLKELDELEAKAAELDRREQGVEVVITEAKYGFSYSLCGICYNSATVTYCRNCGTKLIWPDK